VAREAATGNGSAALVLLFGLLAATPQAPPPLDSSLRLCRLRVSGGGRAASCSHVFNYSHRGHSQCTMRLFLLGRGTPALVLGLQKDSVASPGVCAFV
jgi:hypothetical protein